MKPAPTDEQGHAVCDLACRQSRFGRKQRGDDLIRPSHVTAESLAASWWSLVETPQLAAGSAYGENCEHCPGSCGRALGFDAEGNPVVGESLAHLNTMPCRSSCAQPAGSCRSTQYTEGSQHTMMSPEHADWQEFIKQLEGPEGCNFRKHKADGRTIWDCSGASGVTSIGHEHSRRILTAMGLTQAEIAESLEYFQEHGGYCDCEVLLNVNSP